MRLKQGHSSGGWVQAVRAKIVAWLRESRGSKDGVILSDFLRKDQDGSSWERWRHIAIDVLVQRSCFCRYCDKIATLNVYADHVTILAACMVFQVDCSLSSCFVLNVRFQSDSAGEHPRNEFVARGR